MIKEFPMSATGATRTTGFDERSGDRSNSRGHAARRLVTETKAAFKDADRWTRDTPQGAKREQHEAEAAEAARQR
jgi:hypothetical protein